VSDDPPSPWEDALLAARLFAADPAKLSGIRVRARAGPVRDRWLVYLKSQLHTDTPFRKIPAGIGADRLLGGLDLAATLSANRPVYLPGVLAEADGGIAILPMAERTAPHVCAGLMAVLDEGEVVVERDGLTLRSPARIGVVMLDEGVDDEAPPAALIERMAMTVSLEGITINEAEVPPAEPAKRGAIVPSDSAIATLCSVAAAFGIDSARAPILALSVATANAAEAGRSVIVDEDLVIATRLALFPRARTFPQAESEPDTPDEDETPPDDDTQGEREDDGEIGQVADRVIEAIRSALPPDVLAELEKAAATGRSTQSGRGSAALRKSLTRGRPIGVRPGKPGAGARLHLIETLRAAAPWQKLRRKYDDRPGIRVRSDDFRIRRFAERSESTLIFVVDASGSAAVERLAETKGAVELLLAEAYVRRTQVALIAFRGGGAEIILPPTRSLVRAKKCLADMVGGGGTPLAAGVQAGQALAEAQRGQGRTPFLILMTDGRANIARDGTPGRVQADEDAKASAKLLGFSGIKSVVIDIAARPRDDARLLAAAMGADYAALPRVDAQAMRSIVTTLNAA
jgi:magnesium chelatase subunit D